MRKEKGELHSQEKGREPDTKNDSILAAGRTPSVIKPDAFTQFMKDLANTRNHPFFFEGSE